MALFSIKVGTRVKTYVGGQPVLGTVVSIAPVGPWVEVRWDGREKTQHYEAGKLLDPAIGPSHWHRCEWCGLLEECNQACTEGGPHDPYGKDEWEDNGLVLPGGHCDRDCYNHKRPRGAQHNMTSEGRLIEFANF